MSLQLDDLDHEASVEDLLKMVIVELRIIKMHLAIASDDELTEDDLEE